MNDATFSMYMLRCLEEGIVPMRSDVQSTRSSVDVITDLHNMTPKEARKAKRKFRKMWRKLRRKGERFDDGIEKLSCYVRAERVDRKMLVEARKMLVE